MKDECYAQLFNPHHQHPIRSFLGSAMPFVLLTSDFVATKQEEDGNALKTYSVYDHVCLNAKRTGHVRRVGGSEVHCSDLCSTQPDRCQPLLTSSGRKHAFLQPSPRLGKQIARFDICLKTTVPSQSRTGDGAQQPHVCSQAHHTTVRNAGWIIVIGPAAHSLFSFQRLHWCVPSTTNFNLSASSRADKNAAPSLSAAQVYIHTPQ